MTFGEFAGYMATRTSSLLEEGFELVGEIPELAGESANIAREFTVALAETSSQFPQKIVDLSSKSATALGDLIESAPNAPGYVLDAFKGLLATYSGDCQNAANNTTTTDDIPSDVVFYPLGSDEVYITGYEGEADNWETGSPGRYPSGVKYPRQPISPKPTGKNKKVPFLPPTQPQACVNKRIPQIGQVFYFNSFMNQYRQRYCVLRWWDNIRVFHQTNGGSFAPSITTQYLTLTPSVIPSNMASLFNASICSPPSAWRLSSLQFGKYVEGYHADYYQDLQSCNWTNEFWMDGALVGQPGQSIKYGEIQWESDQTWAECWTSEYGYGNPGGSWSGGYGIKTKGWGKSVLYTYSEAVFFYQGMVNPDDIRDTAHIGVYLALHNVQSFNSLSTLLLGEYGIQNLARNR